MNAPRLESARDVVKALDGVAAVAAMTCSQPKRVANWQSEGRFPPKTYVVMTQALDARGMTAPFSLWQMILPMSKRRSSARRPKYR